MRQVQVDLAAGLVAVMAGDEVLTVLDMTDLGIERAYDPGMGRRANPRLVARAQVSGTAFAYVAGRLDRDAALARIAEVTTDPDILTAAAAVYVDTDPGDPYAVWHGRMVDLMREAGADLDQARQLRHAARPGLT